MRIPFNFTTRLVLVGLATLIVAGTATAVAIKASRPATHTAHTALTARPSASPAGTAVLPASATPTPTPGSNPSPLTTPKPTTAAAPPKATPKPPVIDSGLDLNKPSPTPLRITAASASQTSMTCAPGEIDIEFFQIILTGNSGNAGGNAVAHLEFPDGARTDDQIIPFTPLAPGSSSQVPVSERYIALQFTPGTATAADFTYRVQVTAPNSFTSGWIGFPFNYWCPNFTF